MSPFFPNPRYYDSDANKGTLLHLRPSVSWQLAGYLARLPDLCTTQVKFVDRGKSTKKLEHFQDHRLLPPPPPPARRILYLPVCFFRNSSSVLVSCQNSKYLGKHVLGYFFFFTEYLRNKAQLVDMTD